MSALLFYYTQKSCQSLLGEEFGLNRAQFLLHISMFFFLLKKAPSPLGCTVIYFWKEMSVHCATGFCLKLKTDFLLACVWWIWLQTSTHNRPGDGNQNVVKQKKEEKKTGNTWDKWLVMFLLLRLKVMFEGLGTRAAVPGPRNNICRSVAMAAKLETCVYGKGSCKASVIRGESKGTLQSWPNSSKNVNTAGPWCHTRTVQDHGA